MKTSEAQPGMAVAVHRRAETYGITHGAIAVVDSVRNDNTIRVQYDGSTLSIQRQHLMPVDPATMPLWNRGDFRPSGWEVDGRGRITFPGEGSSVWGGSCSVIPPESERSPSTGCTAGAYLLVCGDTSSHGFRTGTVGISTGPYRLNNPRFSPTIGGQGRSYLGANDWHTLAPGEGIAVNDEQTTIVALHPSHGILTTRHGWVTDLRTVTEGVIQRLYDKMPVITRRSTLSDGDPIYVKFAVTSEQFAAMGRGVLAIEGYEPFSSNTLINDGYTMTRSEDGSVILTTRAAWSVTDTVKGVRIASQVLPVKFFSEVRKAPEKKSAVSITHGAYECRTHRGSHWFAVTAGAIYKVNSDGTVEPVTDGAAGCGFLAAWYSNSSESTSFPLPDGENDAAFPGFIRSTTFSMPA